MDTKPIHTLNAREHMMLESLRDAFQLSPEHMFNAIQNLRHTVAKILSSKGIRYDALKSALVPDRQRKEIALVFDTTAIESRWYGYDVFAHVIPLLDRGSNCSILDGDYLDRPGHTQQLVEAFNESVTSRHNVKFLHPTQFHIVYLNNLTDAMVDRFDDGLKGYEAYVGFADMSCASRLKTYLSTMLVNRCLKHGKIILQGHESDRDNTENINISGYPFEKNGFECRSLADDLMGVLLSYKIERPIFPGFESDTHFALNAVSITPLPLDDFDIQVDEAKLNYLKTEKSGSMLQAGLTAIDSEGLAAMIQGKVRNSYIYNLSFNREHNVIKFNVIIEIQANQAKRPTRLLASLAYQPERKVLRLITLY